MKRLYTILAILTLSLLMEKAASAQGRFYDHLDYGVEWGYTATFQYQHNFLYYSETGAKVDSRDNDLTYKSNGMVLGFAGFKFAKVLSLNACAGWAGVYEGRRVFPLTIRGSVFPRGYANDGFKLLFEGGRCFAESFENQKIWMAKIGAGYRVMLSRNISLDFGLSAQMVSDHPIGVYDAQNNVIVDDALLLRSDTHYSGLSLVMSLSF